MNIKKLFALLAGVSLVAQTVVPSAGVFATTYTQEEQDAYNWAYGRSITTMSPIDNANMKGKITRAELAKMLANWAKSSDKVSVTMDETKSCEFTDTASVKGDLGVAITESCQMGLMGQGITAFRPYDTITRAEFGTALSRALWGSKYEGGTPYYEKHLKALQAAGIMKYIDGNWPASQEVRGYVMIMLMRVENTDIADKDAPVDENGDPVKVPGYVMISGKAAAEQTVALNAVEAKIGTVTLKAGENDSVVTNIEITKSGLGNIKDIATIQLMKDGEYVSNAANFGSKRTATLRFSPKLSLKAGASETFDVVVNLNAYDGQLANGQHDFTVTNVTVVNGKYEGTPVELGSLVTTNYKVAEVKVEKFNQSNSVKAGDDEAELISFDLKPAEEAAISSVTLTSSKDELNKVLSNVKAYIDDEVVGTVKVNDETISIDGLNKTVKKNKSINVTLKGDVTYVGETLI